jgi:hypothetical protein
VIWDGGKTTRTRTWNGKIKYIKTPTNFTLLENWVDDAYYKGLRVVLCMHDPYPLLGGEGYYNYYTIQKEFQRVLKDSNVVAVFAGHLMGNNVGRTWSVQDRYGRNTINAFGNDIPIIFGGHSGDGHSNLNHAVKHKFVVARFRDYSLNYAVYDSTDGTPTLLPKQYDVFTDCNGWRVFSKAPEIEFSVNSPITEGETKEVASGVFKENDPHNDDTFTTMVDYGDNESSSFNYWATSQWEHIYDFNLRHKYIDDGVYTIQVDVTDSQGNLGNAAFKVTVLNADPVINSTQFSKTPTAEVPVSLTGYCWDPGLLDTHNATVLWGDGAPSIGMIVYLPDWFVVFANHTYDTPGNYTVRLIVTDNDGGKCRERYEIAVRALPITHISVVDEATCNVTSENNCTISDYQFSKEDSRVSFRLSWLPGDCGKCNVSIPNTLMWVDSPDEWDITVNGIELWPEDRVITNNGTHCSISFTCPTSNADIYITSTYVIPEMPLTYLLSTFIIATLAIVTIHRKRACKSWVRL